MPGTAYQITFDQKQMAQMKKRLDPDLYKAEVDRLNRSLGHRIAKEARKRAPVFTGALRRSIVVATPPSAGSKTRAVVVVNARYGKFVHDGTRPHFPPPRKLEPWARAKGLNAWAVAHGIAKRGIKPKPFLRDAIRVVRKDAQAEVRVSGRNAEKIFETATPFNAKTLVR